MSPIRDPLFDGRRLGAYPRRVDSSPPDSQTTPPHTAVHKSSGRRSASGAEQERRKAWGREWGGRVAANWKAIQKRMGER